MTWARQVEVSGKRVVSGALVAGALSLGSALPAAAAAAAAGPAAATAATGTGWLKPVTLSAAGDLGTYPVSGMDGAGDIVAVWAELHGSGSDYRIMTASRPADAGWSSPTALSPSGLFADSPQVATARNGETIAVWDAGGVSSGGTPPPPFIQAAVRLSPTSAWSAPMRVSGPTAEADEVALAMDGRGDATAVWATTASIQSSTWSSTSRSWSRPVTLATSADDGFSNPEVAADAGGDLVAVWKNYRSGGVLNGMVNRVFAATRPAGRTGWSRPVAIGTEAEPPMQGSATFEIPGPRVAMDRGGDAMCVFQAKVGPDDYVTDEATRLASVGRWQHEAVISPDSGLEPQVAMDAAGGATVVWTGDSNSVATSSRTLTGTWSTPVTLSVSGSADPYPQVTLDRSGGAVAAWVGSRGIDASVRSGWSAAWKAASLGAGGVVALAVNQSGDAVAVWQRFTGDPQGIVVRADRYLAS